MPRRALNIAGLAIMLLAATTLGAQIPPGCQNIVVQEGFEGPGRWVTVPGPGLVTGNPERQSAAGPAQEGQMYLEVASSGPTWVRQVIQTVPNATYLLGFAYKPRPSYDSSLDVYWNNQQLASLLRPGDSGTGWRYFETTVVANGGDQLDFRDVSATAGRERAGGALVDDVYLCRRPGIAESCCCGPNDLKTRDEYPTLNFALKQSGDFVRIWWDQKDHEDSILVPFLDQPIVSGSLSQDPFGDGVVALTSAGNIARVAERGGQWIVELVMPRHVQRIGGIRSCTLMSTTEGKFKGIWGVTGNFISRFFLQNGEWTFNWVEIGDHGGRIVPSSIHEAGDGRIAGLLQSGQRWNIWFDNGDPKEMRFGYSAGSDIAVPPDPDCTRRE